MVQEGSAVHVIPNVQSNLFALNTQNCIQDWLYAWLIINLKMCHRKSGLDKAGGHLKEVDFWSGFILKSKDSLMQRIINIHVRGNTSVLEVWLTKDYVICSFLFYIVQVLAEYCRIAEYI